LVTGSVLIKRPLYTSLFDVLVSWSKPQTLKDIIDSDKYTQYMIPSTFIDAIVKRFKLNSIHKDQVDLLYMTLNSTGENDRYFYLRNDFNKISDDFLEFISFITGLYENQHWGLPILIKNIKDGERTDFNDLNVQLRFVKDLFTLARVDV